MLHDPALAARLGAPAGHAERGARSASRITRLLLLTEPPSLDAGEITDKGYINQRQVLARRAGLVDMLYRDLPAAPVITGAGLS